MLNQHTCASRSRRIPLNFAASALVGVALLTSCGSPDNSDPGGSSAPSGAVAASSGLVAPDLQSLNVAYSRNLVTDSSDLDDKSLLAAAEI
jgi:hypothetical protein